MRVGFSHFLIGFLKKSIMTKMNMSPKNVERSVDVSFGSVSCDILRCKGGFQPFFDWVS
jgi:hypothetical protein